MLGDTPAERVREYFETARTNESAIPAKFSVLVDGAHSVAALYARLTDVPSRDRSEWVAAGLMRRAHSFWLSAFRLLLGGAVPETFALLRVVLEAGAYARLVTTQPELQRVWLNRHAAPADRKRMKDAFLIGNAKQAVRDRDEALGRRLDVLYDYLIDFGGHPNPGAVYASSNWSFGEDEAHIDIGYLTGRPERVHPGFRRLIEVGLCTLLVLETVFPDRFRVTSLDVDTRRLDEQLAERS